MSDVHPRRFSPLPCFLPDVPEDDAGGAPAEPRVETRSYDRPLCPPAPPLDPRFPGVPFWIEAGFWAGAPVDVIVASLARGGRWRIGPAREASGPQVIWLLEMEVPYEQQIAAWLLSPPPELDPDPLLDPPRGLDEP